MKRGIKSGGRSNNALRGTDVWSGSGNIAGHPIFGKTGCGESACSFKVAIDKKHKPTTFVRVNVYGGNVEVCRVRDLASGDYVMVSGELMNRRGKNSNETIVEVRCNEIVIVAQKAKYNG
jgi:hypothetical protein